MRRRPYAMLSPASWGIIGVRRKGLLTAADHARKKPSLRERATYGRATRTCSRRRARHDAVRRMCASTGPTRVAPGGQPTRSAFPASPSLALRVAPAEVTKKPQLPVLRSHKLSCQRDAKLLARTAWSCSELVIPSVLERSTKRIVLASCADLPSPWRLARYRSLAHGAAVTIAQSSASCWVPRLLDGQPFSPSAHRTGPC
jgi:hypothetical protein